jgi:hypothetical protein
MRRTVVERGVRVAAVDRSADPHSFGRGPAIFMHPRSEPDPGIGKLGYTS